MIIKPSMGYRHSPYLRLLFIIILTIFIAIGCGGGGDSGGNRGSNGNGDKILFSEKWETSALGVYGPDINKIDYEGISSDSGKWFIGDTVSEFPECGEPINTANIISHDGSKALKLIARRSLEGGCADNIWADNSWLDIPIRPNTYISFYEIGELINPEHGVSWCFFPPCNNEIYLALYDNHGNMLAYILQYPEDYTSADDNPTYGEIFLTSVDGLYSRDIYTDFQIIENFDPLDSYIDSIVLTVDPNNKNTEDIIGWAIIDNILIEKDLNINEANCTDNDSDGYHGQNGCGTAVDCNDNNASIHPGVAEICGDGIDNDCDMAIDCADMNCANSSECLTCTDSDSDGYYSGSGCGTAVDCNDNNASIHPGAAEICGNGIDNDCDEAVDEGCQIVTTSRIPDTSQTTSYTDFFGEDSDYTINPQSYTKLDDNGNDLPDSATTWVMVRDNVTGLIWENKTNDGGIHDFDNIYNWQNAQDVFITQLNNGSFGGNSDWRLPTVKELATLRHLDQWLPAINTSYFPNTMSSDYWSSTTDADNTGGAWYVSFYDSGVGSNDKSNNYYVRAVRAGQSGVFDDSIIPGRMLDNGDGTVTDTETGLMWQQGEPGLMTWITALTYCETLQLAGYNDWKLPDINELQSIVDYQVSAININTTAFPEATASRYWSSTTNANNTGCAWDVNFGYGYVSNYGYKSYNYDVRAVRGGQ